MLNPRFVPTAARPAVPVPVSAPPADHPPDPARFELLALPLLSGQRLVLQLPRGSMLVLAEGQAALQRPACDLVGGLCLPALQVLGEGQAWTCDQAGSWQLAVLRSGRLLVQRPQPFTRRWRNMVQRMLRPVQAVAGLRSVA